MRILLVGGVKTENAAKALEQRFNTVETKTVSTVEQIKVLGNGGERFERVILFEQAITNDGVYLDTNVVRERAQKIVDALKESLDTFDFIGVADSNVVIQALKEEIFEIKHRAVVVHIKNKALSANILAGLASKNIADLRTIYKDTDVDRSIYRNANTVIWSSEVEKSEDWDIGFDTQTGAKSIVSAKSKLEFNPLTGQFEEVKPNDPGENNSIEQNKQSRVEKPKKRLFGNRKI